MDLDAPGAGPEYSLEMSVGAAAATSTSPQPAVLRHVATREPPLAVALATVVTVLAAACIAVDVTAVQGALRNEPVQLVFWGGIVLIVNLFPVAFGKLRLCLDMPVLMAVAVTYQPAVGATLAAVAAFDRREVRREIALSNALFNRAQLALSVFVASTVFHGISPDLYAWQGAIVGTGVALATSYAANVSLVTTYAAIQERMGRQGLLTFLRTAAALPFLGTYLGYGVLGLVLARLFVDVGAWAVVSFVLPILVARAMFVRAQAVEVLAQRLREREHLLEGLLDSVIDERRDERLRIGGDLHDEVLQTVLSIRMLARLIEREVRGSNRDSQATLRDSRQLVRSADRALKHLRGVIHDLQESPLGRRGLAPTLRRLVQDLRSEWRAPIDTELSCPAEIPASLQTVIYQVAREALLNAVKHSRAERILIRIGGSKDVVTLVVQDNGIGFITLESDHNHFGLGLMRERVQRVGGSLHVRSRSGVGTSVEATFALREETAEPASVSASAGG